MNAKINLLITNLNEQLNFLVLEFTDAIKHSEKAIEMIVKSLDNLKALIIKNKFRTETEEIIFFKEVKPQVFSKLIFHTKVLKIETKRPFHFQGSFNNGKAEIKEIASYFESIFNIDLGDVYISWYSI